MDKSAIVDDAADEAQYIEAADVQAAYKSLPLLQRVFVVLRPWWWRDTKPFFTLQEFSGAFGDLGNYFPFIISLAVTKQIAFGPTLFFSGLFNVMIAAYFDIPIPVLPLRTVSAVAIASKYSKTEIAATGLLHGLVIFGLGITNLVTVVARYVPFCLVRGVQLGVGLQLLQNGVKQAYVHSATVTVNNKTHAITVKRSTDQLVWWGTDSIFVSIVLVLFCLGCMHRKGVPVALAVFIYGVIIAAINYHHMKGEWKLPDLSLGPDFSGMPDWPSHDDFKNAFVNMVLPQIPLSLLSGVLALEMLARDYYPNHKAPPASVRRISISMGFGDLAFCGFGMLAMGHGPGGLAAQYAFGARTNFAMLFLGGTKLVVFFIMGSTLVQLLQDGVFPSSVIGILVLFAGLFLSIVGLDIETRKHKGDVVVLLVTADTSLAIDTGRGFLVGAVTYLILRFAVNDPSTYKMISGPAESPRDETNERHEN
ncbi:unnamed protein product [Aphanomyces euteiches]|uniref:SLC26A/SulP transporter domain-containing protein n=1 Tax=Aphanomyces euteiches TaxID=100861 RepID=A0A6G0X2Z0_9STRA|nr:hypothetical protein Ae201684_009019 [Aphanomyces euteiches]KAH9073807.1 hypothetical protein Ae201684P_003309 [Aphanomyces euteiches]